MRNTIIMSVLALALLTLVVLNRQPRRVAAPVPTAPQATITQQPTQAVSHITPVMAQEIKPTQVERDLADIERSPAKDTPEAKQIEALLTKYGFDRSALPAAYRYAFARDKMLRLMGTNLNEGERFHLDAVMRTPREELERYGTLTETFMEDLHAIHPTVFFGQRDLSWKPVIPR